MFCEDQQLRLHHAKADRPVNRCLITKNDLRQGTSKVL